MNTGWAYIVAAVVTGSTAILTMLLMQRYERQRSERERQDRLLGLLLEPRLRAHEQVVTFLVELSRK
jgi:hypothetical protein